MDEQRFIWLLSMAVVRIVRLLGPCARRPSLYPCFETLRWLVNNAAAKVDNARHTPLHYACWHGFDVRVLTCARPQDAIHELLTTPLQ